MIQRDDGRNVVGGSQCFTDRNRTMLDQSIVARRITLQTLRDKRRAHVQQHGGGSPGRSLFGIEGDGIRKRLEGRTRLSRGTGKVSRTGETFVKVIGPA